MQRDHRSAVLTLAFLVMGPAVQADEGTDSLLITGARILDVAAGRYVEGRDVFIRGERIERLAPASHIEVPEATQRGDASGLTPVPGLIDLHTHLLLHPSNA